MTSQSRCDSDIGEPSDRKIMKRLKLELVLVNHRHHYHQEKIADTGQRRRSHKMVEEDETETTKARRRRRSKEEDEERWVTSSRSPDTLHHLFITMARQRIQTLELRISPPLFDDNHEDDEDDDSDMGVVVPGRQGRGGGGGTGRQQRYCQSYYHDESQRYFSSSQSSSSNNNNNNHYSHYTMKLIPILQRVRQLGILSHLTLADSSLWDGNSYHHQHRSYSLLFEILTNPTLETLQLNLPASTTTCTSFPTTKTSSSSSTRAIPNKRNPNLLRLLGYAIAMNPCLKTLVVYSYQDIDGMSTTMLLEPLVSPHEREQKQLPSHTDKLITNHRRRRHRHGQIQALHLFCPLHCMRGPSRILSTVSRLLRDPNCILKELEISCIQHHLEGLINIRTVVGVGDDLERRDDNVGRKNVFGLSQLVQEGILRHQTGSLTTLGLFHCGLTTTQVDQDLFYPLLWHVMRPPSSTSSSPVSISSSSSSLAYIRLDGNQIDSLYFPFFMGDSCSHTGGGCHWHSLKTVHMDHNPWQRRSTTHRQFQSLLVSPTQHCQVMTGNRHDHHHHYGGNDRHNLTPSTSVGKDSKQWNLPTMLYSLFQRHPQLVYFGVDPISYFSSTSRRGWSFDSTSPHTNQYVEQVDRLAFATVLNRSGFRPKQQQEDFLMHMPPALWPRVLHRILMGKGVRDAEYYLPGTVLPPTKKNDYYTRFHKRKHGLHTNQYDRDPRPYHHRQPSTVQGENYEASLIFHLLLHYHQWMIPAK